MYAKSELHSDIARVTWKGILFRGLYYSCATAISQEWFENARVYGGWKIRVHFTPGNSEIIYLERQNQVEPEKCYRIIRQNISPTKLDKYFESIQKLKRERNNARK